MHDKNEDTKEPYLEPNQKSTVELFPKKVNYFWKNVPP